MRIDVKIRNVNSPLYIEEELRSELKVLLLGEEVNAKNIRDVDYLIYPTGISSPLSVHENEEEIFYIMRGKGLFFLNDREIMGRAGEAIAVPARTKHWVKNTGSCPLHLVVCSAKI